MALWALVGSLACVLSEVISQVARFLKDARTAGISALEKQLNTLGLRIFYLDSFVPARRNSIEGLTFYGLQIVLLDSRCLSGRLLLRLLQCLVLTIGLSSWFRILLRLHQGCFFM